MDIYKDRSVFCSDLHAYCQQSPKLTLTGSDMGLVLTANANLTTKTSLMSYVYIHTSRAKISWQKVEVEQQQPL